MFFGYLQKLSSTKSVHVKKGSFANLSNVNTERGSSRRTAYDQFDQAVSHHGSVLLKENTSLPSDAVSIGCRSPSLFQDYPVSMEDAMSTCNSTGSSDLEFLHDEDPTMAASLHWWASDGLQICDCMDVTGLFAYLNRDSSG